MPPKTLVAVGAAAILLAFTVCWTSVHWLETRTFQPVNMLVVLEAGKAQTVDFEINVRGVYGVGLSAEYSIDDWTAGKCSSSALADADWKVYRLKAGAIESRELWASSEEMRQQGERPYGFRGAPGKYALEWSVPSKAVCLNARNPQLSVRTDSDAYATAFGFVLIGCLFVAMVGAGATLRATVLWLQASHGGNRAPRIFPEMTIRNVVPLWRHRPMLLIRVLPDFRVAWFCIVGVLAAVFCLFVSRSNWPLYGLPIDFRAERTVGVLKSPWTETMAVYVAPNSQFFVNGKLAAREELRQKLQEQLMRRGIWVVYFEADYDSLYMDAVYAMDTIQGLGAKVIWITPKTREEWKKRGAS